MNWDALGAIAELIGGIAVLATLIYLSAQIRYARKAQQQQTVTVQTNRCIAAGRQLVESAEFADIMNRGLAGKELNPVEFQQLSGHLFGVLTDFEEMYYLHKDGDAAEFRWKNLILHAYWQIRPGTTGNDWWHRMKTVLYTPEFIAYVDDLLENGPSEN